jgi:hypothetical protein
MVWVEIQKQPGRRLAKWQRSAAMSEDGNVFVPAAIAGNEKRVFLSATWDSIPIVMEYGHLYVPKNWMIREFPETLEVCTLIESKVRTAAGNA